MRLRRDRYCYYQRKKQQSLDLLLSFFITGYFRRLSRHRKGFKMFLREPTNNIFNLFSFVPIMLKHTMFDRRKKKIISNLTNHHKMIRECINVFIPNLKNLLFQKHKRIWLDFKLWRTLLRCTIIRWTWYENETYVFGGNKWGERDINRKWNFFKLKQLNSGHEKRIINFNEKNELM